MSKASRLVELSTEQAATLDIHCSPSVYHFKKNKARKWRIIVDLSARESASVNDGIRKELCSVSYTSVDIVADHVMVWGTATHAASTGDIDIPHNISSPMQTTGYIFLGMRGMDGKMYNYTETKPSHSGFDQHH